MVGAADVKALWSGFASLPDSDVEAMLEQARREVTARFGVNALSEEDFTYAVKNLAAHYLAIAHGLVVASYSIAGISQSVAFDPPKDPLRATVWGEAYYKFCRQYDQGNVSLGRTG